MRRARLAVLAAVFGLLASLTVGSSPASGVVHDPPERPDLCGEDDLPETGLQGDVPRADQRSGRAKDGYNCGLSLVGHTALDADGRQPTGNANMAWSGSCAYVAGSGALFGRPADSFSHGVAVVDVSDPENPVHVTTLETEGSRAALETLHAIETPERSILVVGEYGNQAGGDKPMDVYDVTDCAKPELLTTYSWPENIHNLTLSGNGRYVYATQPLQVLDLEPLLTGTGDPVYLGNLEGDMEWPLLGTFAVAEATHLAGLPKRQGADYSSHEAWPTHDGTKLYLGGQLPTFEVFTIVDITAWLDRESGAPAGPPEIISQRAGRGHSVRTATVDGTPFVLHSEESILDPTAKGCLPEWLNPVGGPAEPWLTDISDEADPVLVSRLGLEINQPLNCGAQIDSGVNASVHYHDLDDPDDTTFAMLSMWHAGLRVFDLRDPEQPVEVAYFNPADVNPNEGSVTLDRTWGHVRYVPETGHIWFATATGGFWVVELQPQVREHLELDDVTIQHPQGRPGTAGVVASLSALDVVDTSAWYCTLGAATAVPRGIVGS